MYSARHHSLIRELRALPAPSWLETVLLSCLERLRDGGPTEWEQVRVDDAWVDGDTISIVYLSPGGQQAGLIRGRSSLSVDDPVEAGRDMADYDVAEPLGSVAADLVYDAQGVGWWGG
ncbi:hypothetical protein IWX64_001255 [Arthrobacter sp. CAN_A212]|uniref:hypothetical protein n=1 Tax=Arthrobacter sp. CAN_A212 TaxID=2787719 RepID=UPI0018C90729